MRTKGLEQLEPTRNRGLLETFWRNFKKNKLSLVGAGIVISFIIMAVFAGLISPYNPSEQFKAAPGEHHPLRPLSKGEDGKLFLLGTDKFGRDLLSRSLFGSRTLLEVAVGAITVAFITGASVGAVAGYKNGTWIDELLMRAVDVMLSFPTLVLAIALLSVFGLGAMKIGPFTISNMLKVTVVIAITYSPQFARLMRSVVLREMAEDYVTAAKASGASNIRVLGKEIFPNAVPSMMVQASLMTATAVLKASSLGFLGVGLQPPHASLGIMLSEAQGFLLVGAWWYALVPGVFISLAVFGFNLLGDGLRDSLDPKQARSIRG